MSRQRPTFGRRRVASLVPLVAATSFLVILIVPAARNTVEEAVGGSGASPNEAPGHGVQAVSSSIRYADGQLLVKFKEGTPQAVMDAVLAQAGVTSERAIGRVGARALRVEGGRREAALAALMASPAVEYAERNVIVQVLAAPNDPKWSSQWGPRTIGAPSAWETTRGSPGIVIAVLDTGAELTHPDLNGAFVAGYDVVNRDSDPQDDNGHGTAAAGVLAARTNNGRGIAGVCWECRIMPVKVLDANGSGTNSAVAAGIVWAVDHGARVISMSLGGPGTTQTLTDAIGYATRRGVLLVAAAGNNGSTAPFYPAAYPEVLSVAGTDTSDKLYSWSNYGSWVKVAGPGCNTTTTLGGGYGSFCGTSSATPVVAGLVGLAVSVRPESVKGEVENAIQQTAYPIGTAVQNGRVDAVPTLTALGAPEPAATGEQVVAPSNEALPRIEGATTVGQTLTADPGGWAGTQPFTFAYQWLRCSPSCSNIPGATAQSYRLALADADRRIRVRVRAQNGAGSSDSSSNATGLILMPPPANTSLPTIAGTPRVGEYLTAGVGRWANSPTGYTYRWKRCDVGGLHCTRIDGATTKRYHLASADRGFAILVVVTAFNSGGSRAATSSSTQPTKRR